MAFAAALAPIISGVASIAAAGVQASALNQAADDEERIAQFNADREKEQAAYAQSAGALESRKRKEEAEKAAARARAARAQGGVATDTGSALLLEQDFASESSFNQRVAMYNAERQKSEHLNEAKIGLFEGQVRANAKRSQAGAAMLSGFAGAVKGFG
jgi:hypothetical protein